MNNQKIYILTFHRAVNYGAVWQCFALTQVLKSGGFDVQVIDYFPDFLKRHHTKLPKKPLNFILKLLIIRKLNKFVNKEFPLTKQYQTKEELKKNLPQSDIYICGSDQIWNKRIVGNDLSTYLFDFVPNNLKKISYAASIGGNKIADEDKHVFIDALKSFHALSVREKLAQTEIERLTNLSPQIVLDPTLIANRELFINQVSKRFSGKDYVLVIDLEKNSLLRECAKSVSKKENIPIINISGAYYGYAKNPLGISPNDWLDAIYNAKYVFVNSFHGLCFSIIFEKEFFYVHKKIEEGNNRPRDLLKIINLNERYIENLNEEINISSKIDYIKVNMLLKSRKDHSISYLRNALNAGLQ